MLFDPAKHERVTETPWSEPRARDAVRAIAADAEQAFDEDALWPAHPLDELDDGPPIATLYLGAGGVVWALDELQRLEAAEPGRSWAPLAVALHERYLAAPDFPDLVGVVPSLLMGESGLLLVAHRLAPADWQEERLLACVRDNAANPTCELMWGSPGTMVAAQVMHERTGDDRWEDAWRESADRLWRSWGEDGLWEVDLYGRPVRLLGPVHGFAGNIYALARGTTLDDARRAELETRAGAVLARYARREGELVQWPAAPDPRHDREGVTQWCHGAPGIVASLTSLAPGSPELGELLAGGGELTWAAGPLAKGPGLCHGTAGNGFAFLKLFERTGDERWLDRARAFAMHALEQVERQRAEVGRGRYTLWTGDLGVALYVWACCTGEAAFPTVDSF